MTNGQRNRPDLSRAMDTSRRLNDAMDSASGTQEAGPTRGSGKFLWLERIMNAATPSTPPVERYVRDDGKVGLILSNGFFSGWSTRIRLVLDPMEPSFPRRARRMEEIAIFDKDIVAAVLAGDIPRARAVAIKKMKLPRHFSRDNTDLRVVWVARGDEFEVISAPESEEIRLKEAIEFWRA